MRTLETEIATRGEVESSGLGMVVDEEFAIGSGKNGTKKLIPCREE